MFDFLLFLWEMGVMILVFFFDQRWKLIITVIGKAVSFALEKLRKWFSPKDK